MAAEDVPITMEELTNEHKAMVNQLKEEYEAKILGCFARTRGAIRLRGRPPEGALEEVDLSTPSEERTRALRQEINYAVAHSLHRHAESLVNSLERIALRVIQEIMNNKYSPSGPTLGSHPGEAAMHSKPQTPIDDIFQQPGSGYFIYKVGGDPADVHFMTTPPVNIPAGYA